MVELCWTPEQIARLTIAQFLCVANEKSPTDRTMSLDDLLKYEAEEEEERKRWFQ